MSLSFRLLRADEIECRVGIHKKGKGITLLLYKDARCDMELLDETVGADRWSRKHYECKGNLFCSVGISNEVGDWVYKDDCGAESNTEKEKGEASDSFKRACVNWGIGRELYTAPFIWIPMELVEVDGDKIKDSFTVSEIGYDDKRRIIRLIINNQKGVTVFPSKKEAVKKDPPAKSGAPVAASESDVKCSKCGVIIRSITGKDGKIYTPSEVAGKCKGMCKPCFLEASRN